MRVQSFLARAVAGLVLAAAAGVAVAAGGIAYSDPCKNHYILVSPAECKWTLSGSMNTPRAGHTATLLRDGRVLVAGGGENPAWPQRMSGWALPPHATDSAEIYDPRTGTWRLVAPLGINRTGHAATLLPDGRVLVVGGETAYHFQEFRNGTAEIFDPATETWSPAASMLHTRWPSTATATTLSDGRVLVAGGWAMDDWPFGAEIRDPASGRWSPGGDLNVGRYCHAAAALPDGRVLVVGGADDITGMTTGSAEIYDPAANRWALTSSAVSERACHAATLLDDGRVLVSGGYAAQAHPTTGNITAASLGSSEIYDPRDHRWLPVAGLAVKRSHHTSTLLPSGAVLTVGGRAQSGLLDSAELRGSPEQASVATLPLNEARWGHTATRLRDGSVLVAGGKGIDGRRLHSAELFGAPRAE